MISALAAIAARNEAGYLDVTLRTLIEEEGIEVVFIDHGSVDGTRETAERWLGQGVLRIVDLPWNGHLDLKALLTAKAEVYRSARHEWVLHLDADEWPRARAQVPLAGFLGSVPARWSVVNLDEFVFLPPPGIDLWGTDYRRAAVSYYHFAPEPLRLMRAWRRTRHLSNIESGGHRLNVPAEEVFPESQVMRHYIGLSWTHVISKRAGRTYDPANLKRGWHGNRTDLRYSMYPENSPLLRRAEPWNTRMLDGDAPSRFHCWQREFQRGEPVPPSRHGTP